MRNLNDVSIQESHQIPFSTLLDQKMLTKNQGINMHPQLKKLKIPKDLFNLSNTFGKRNTDIKKHMEEV